MSLRLYTDVHVRGEITTQLKNRGLDVLTAQVDNAARLSDSDLLDRAASLGRVLFTQDQDFLAEAAKRQRSGRSFPGIIYAHQFHITIGQCISDLELIANVCELQETTNLVLRLPLR